MAQPPIFDRNTHERQKNLLEASYRDEELRQGNKLVGHFFLVCVGAIAVVVALAVGLIQILSR
ncbi:hypothetical protein D3C86_2234510 [compost metagenome]